MIKINLNNEGPVDGDWNVYLPRLQVNKCGEIILATCKHGVFTTGFLVGKTPESKSTLPIGLKCTDWEVVGELVDYDGEVSITFENKIKTSPVSHIAKLIGVSQ